MLGRGRPGRRRDRRGRPRFVGRAGHGCRGRARRRAPLGRSRLEAADARRARGRRARRVRGWARGHRRRAREPRGVRPARHDRGAAARRAAARSSSSPTQGFEPDRIVLDGKHDYLAMPRVVRTIVKGDQTVLSVAAASVVAKVTRDALMAEEAEHYPGVRLRVEPRLPRARAQVRARRRTARRRSTGGRGSSWTTACGAASRASSASRACSHA